eukprot:7512967-Karenia_brevis.AAC.1
MTYLGHGSVPTMRSPHDDKLDYGDAWVAALVNSMYADMSRNEGCACVTSHVPYATDNMSDIFDGALNPGA